MKILAFNDNKKKPPRNNSIPSKTHWSISLSVSLSDFHGYIEINV